MKHRGTAANLIATAFAVTLYTRKRSCQHPHPDKLKFYDAPRNATSVFTEGHLENLSSQLLKFKVLKLWMRQTRAIYFGCHAENCITFVSI